MYIKKEPKMQRVLRGCSREAPLDFRTFSTHISKKLCKIIMLSVFIYTACKSCKGWIGKAGKTN